MHQVHSVHSHSPTCAHRSAQARAQDRVVVLPNAVSWPRTRRVAGLHGHIAGAPVLYRGLPRDTMPSRLASLVTMHPIVLRYNPQLPAPAGHNTIHSIAIQYPLLQPLLVTIQSMYCDPIPLPKLLYCNTKCQPITIQIFQPTYTLLQYTSPLAIQFYWAVAQISSRTLPLFFLFFFSIISSY